MDTPLLVEDVIAGHTGRADHQLAADWSQHLGRFSFYFDDGRWAWSPQVSCMYGYLPGTTAPSTFLVLSHVHLDDYQDVAATLDDVQSTPRSFCSRHRIIDTRNQVRHVVMIGGPFYDVHGAVVGMRGRCLDATAMTRPVSPAHVGKRPQLRLVSHSAWIDSNASASNRGVLASSSR